MADSAPSGELRALAPKIVEISIEAGEAILDHYGRDGQVSYKADGSGVTDADYAAHDIIETSLERLIPECRFLSEESRPIPQYPERQSWGRYWLVDPLDGTSGFIKGTGEFTVNIALIEDSRPVLGVIHIPVSGDTYWAVEGCGAFVIRSGEQRSHPIRVRGAIGDSAAVVGNRSRGVDRRDQMIDSLSRADIAASASQMSSSIKFCLVAEGSADVYAAFGGTSEWDTAAGQCIVECAGGTVTDMQTRSVLRYNKPELGNPWFYASGSDFPWERYG